MFYSRHDAVLIGWGFGDTPTLNSDGTAPFDHYVVSRGLSGDFSDAVVIGRTRAEVYHDTNVQAARNYCYRVQGADDAAETNLTTVYEDATVSTKPQPPHDACAPTTPTGLTAHGVSGGIDWSWDAACKDDPARLLGYFVDDEGVTGQPRGMVYEVDGPTTEWHESVAANGKRTYRLRAVDKDLNISAPSEIVQGASGGGWTVYTFTESMPFTVSSRIRQADILLVGGGGSGGGGSYGGGGGAGGFRDRHDVVIYPHASAAPDGSLESWPDGDVVVGAGGAEVTWDVTAAEVADVAQGGDSKFGYTDDEDHFFGITAYGGGYGGRNDGVESYSASGGGSGGGARGNEVDDGPMWEGGPEQYHGIPGTALYNTDEPVPEGAPEVGSALDALEATEEQGHRGGIGVDHSAWYSKTAGGGGGSQWPAYGGGTGRNGGLGRPCDIQGYGPYWKSTGYRLIPWFGGGGAGKERPNLWGYPDGYGGYGGGGDTGSEGTPHTGGGGGGHGWYGDSAPDPVTEWSGKAPGKAGGSGLVVIRIPTCYEYRVTAPLQLRDENGDLRFESVWNEIDEEYDEVPVYPDGCSVTHLGDDQPHTDEMGDLETPVIWGWPNQSDYELSHFHHWGWDEQHVGE